MLLSFVKICRKSLKFLRFMPIYILQKGKAQEIIRSRDMGLNNISMDYSMQLENRENLRNTANKILNKSGATSEAAQKIIEKTIFEGDKQLKEVYTNPQLSVLKASTQISINNTLKETLKYLKAHANEKRHKEPVFGELWNILSTSNEASEKNPYQGELFDFQINMNAKNIFAAA